MGGRLTAADLTLQSLADSRSVISANKPALSWPASSKTVVSTRWQSSVSSAAKGHGVRPLPKACGSAFEDQGGVEGAPALRGGELSISYEWTLSSCWM